MEYGPETPDPFSLPHFRPCPPTREKGSGSRDYSLASMATKQCSSMPSIIRIVPHNNYANIKHDSKLRHDLKMIFKMKGILFGLIKLIRVYLELLTLLLILTVHTIVSSFVNCYHLVAKVTRKQYTFSDKPAMATSSHPQFIL